MAVDAFWYVKNNLHIVPLAENQKVPISGVSLKEMRTRLPTPEEMQAWFVDRRCNVGLLMGKVNNLFLVDLDTYKNDKLHEWVDKYPTGLRAKSARGGTHLFFKTPDDEFSNSQSLLEQGVDVKTDGGYAVVEPSVFDNKQYRWLSNGQPSPLPPPLLEQLKAGRVTVTQANTDGLLSQVVLHGFDEGNHNAQLKDVARYIYRLADAGQLESVITELMVALDMKDPTPQGLGKVQLTVNSGLAYEKERLAKKKSDTPEINFTVQGIGSVLNKWGDYNVDWFVENWIPKGAIQMIVAPPGAGKTWIVMDAAVSIASGKPFMGHLEIKEQAPTILVNQEDATGLQAQRMRTMMAVLAESRDWKYYEYTDPELGWVISLEHPYFAPIYMHLDAQFRLDREESVSGLESAIKRTGAKFVAVDPLYSIIRKLDDYGASAGSAFMDTLRPLRNKYDLTFWLAHHTRKGSGGTGRQELWGSQILNGAVEGVTIIYQKEGEKYIETSGKFFAHENSHKIRFDICTDVGQEKYDVNLEEQKGGALITNENEAAVMAIFSEVGKPMRQVDVARALDVQSKVAGDVLERLIDKGLVAKSGKNYFLVSEME